MVSVAGTDRRRTTQPRRVMAGADTETARWMSISVPGGSTALVRMKIPNGPRLRMIPRWVLVPSKNSQVSLRLILRPSRRSIAPPPEEGKFSL